MRRFFLLLGLALAALLAFDACGISQQGEADSPDGGGGTGGGSGVGGGTCFPGSKVCPDKSGKLVCVQADTPETGCKGSSSCDACIVPHATPKCDGTGCAIGSCDAGWGDCNGDPVDGCEVNLLNDPTHCGTGPCGTNCIATQGADFICKQGVCKVTDCIPPTTADCDGDGSNGCEVDTTTDVNNCLFCGNKCDLANADPGCSNQVCVVVSCHTGYANCDGLNANGCETNIFTDASNCGTCGNICNSTHGVAGCLLGICGILCSAPWENCDGNASNGCEIDLSSDPNHCGNCNKACNPANVANATCTNGSCGYDSCLPGYADCDGDKANGCEINLQTDDKHCGSCSNACNPPSGGSVVCSSGTCASSCSGGLTLCGNSCVDTTKDPAHCGGCSGNCSGAKCCSSKCQQCCSTSDCSGGHVCSGGSCVCSGSTPKDCGGTCRQCCVNGDCSGGMTCQNWACACPSGTKNCSGTCRQCCSNGDCTGGKTCQSGSCACPSPLLDCSGTCHNCCDNGNCTGGKICDASGNCVCGSGLKDCSGTCKECCGDPDCTGGKTCQSGVCACPNGQNDCSGTCKQCCGNSDCSGGTPNCCGNGTCQACCGNSDCGGGTPNCCSNNTCQECCGNPDCTTVAGQTCQNGTCACPSGQSHICGGACHECCVNGDCTVSPNTHCCSNNTCGPTGGC